MTPHRLLTAESAAELRAVVGATGARRTLVACLRAPGDVLAARLRAREPEGWPGKARLIEHARALAGTIPAIDGIDLTLDSEAHEAEDLALTILAAMRERELV